VRQLPHVGGVAFTGELERSVLKVAVACGSAAEFLADAAQAGCDVLLTGEARFHACLEARALGIALVQAGHYATERPGVEALAGVLKKEFPGSEVFASQVETDPLQWINS
jgi:putative NIF3 family GTP cyclohydrolase 1 type 2